VIARGTLHIVGLTLLLFGSVTHAQEVPRWEAGVGVGALHAPDYRGADEGRSYVLPLPYVIYRSDILNIDREGVRSRFARVGAAQLDLSASVGIPVNSEQNRARAGMPNLDPTLEIGAALNVALGANGSHHPWTLRLPLRLAVATDLTNSEVIGWVFAPNVDFHAPDFPVHGLDMHVAAGPLFASERFHDYYYEVAPAYATPDRPAYDARGGYSGSRITVTAGGRYGQLWMGVFARYDTLAGAVFTDSPLVKRQDWLMVGVGVAYVFAHSDDTVTR
jgi:outer membrane protein